MRDLERQDTSAQGGQARWPLPKQVGFAMGSRGTTQLGLAGAGAEKGQAPFMRTLQPEEVDIIHLK